MKIWEGARKGAGRITFKLVIHSLVCIQGLWHLRHTYTEIEIAAWIRASKDRAPLEGFC